MIPGTTTDKPGTIEDCDIDCDIEDCVPTVRVVPEEYRNSLEGQVYDEFWQDECWSKVLDQYLLAPITQRSVEKQASRDADARALASGEKTREQLWKENTFVPASTTSVDILSIPIPKR